MKSDLIILPQVKHSKSINELSNGLGAERTCHFEDGNKIKERITAYQSGKEYEVEIYDPGSFPLTKTIARLQVTSVNNDVSEVSFLVSFQSRFGPLCWIMAKMAPVEHVTE